MIDLKLLIWFVLWLVACFSGYKLARSQGQLESDDWLTLFFAVILVLFCIYPLGASQ